METSLHRQLKEQFREPGSEIEVKLGRYRIDVVNGDRLVEIQQSGLAAIRDKIRKLVEQYEVDVVKPLIARKRLVKLAGPDGPEVSRRWSPKQGTMLDLFDELLYFTRVFPHENLRLIVPLVEIEELRYPGHGKRRRWRRNDFVIADRKLVKTVGMEVFETASDLHRLLPEGLETPFDTAALAAGLGIRRWEAQRVAYVMNKTGALNRVGKKGNAFLYDLSVSSAAAASKKTATIVTADSPEAACSENEKKVDRHRKKKAVRKRKKKAKKKRTVTEEPAASVSSDVPAPKKRASNNPAGAPKSSKVKKKRKKKAVKRKAVRKKKRASV
ncbi:MAG: hypothetical protein AAF456_05555 [Planctomycetota bacterium]